MAGRHSKTTTWRRPRQAPAPRRRLIEVVDARTRRAHWVTPDAHAAAYDPQVPCVALCGADVLPAALVEPGKNRCRSCAVA